MHNKRRCSHYYTLGKEIKPAVIVDAECHVTCRCCGEVNTPSVRLVAHKEFGTPLLSVSYRQKW